jgi:4-hydroxy-tetrahydrodipicolinate reductase
MKTRIIVNGAAGKMGQIACEVLENHIDFELVARCTRNDNLALAIADTKAQAVIDVTEPAAVFNNTKTILEQQARPIIGTTGLTEEQLNEIKNQCQEKSLGCIIAPNFSIGALLLMQCAKQVARFMAECEIIELHHPAKKDAPSGTAIKTANIISQARQRPSLITRQGDANALGYMDASVPIHSVRLPGILADETVIFGNTGESLTLQHRTLSRDAFKPGILLACQKVMALDHMVYGLENLLFE